MPKVHALFWFDVEDCMVPQSDDATKRLAQILTRCGVRGTMKVVGQKARLLEQRLRFDVVDALREHDLGYHSNLHGLRPQIAEYLAPLDMEAGAREFDTREAPGLEDVRRLFGRPITTYGQPGPNWAPQPFAVLRQWGIPTYVSGFGYVGLDCAPFRYGGLLCTSHLHGRRNGQAESHLMGLNFELGRPGELARHQATFARSREQLAATGGLISILNHPCTLVLEEWFSTSLKPRELTEAGYQHFEEFVRWLLEQPDVVTTSAGELPALYPDLAVGHSFGQAELATVAEALIDAVGFVRLGELTLSAAEAFGLVARALGHYRAEGRLPETLSYRPVFNPRRPAAELAEPFTVPATALLGPLPAVLDSVRERQEVPSSVAFNGQTVPPGDWLAAAARVLRELLAGGEPPESVTVAPTPRTFEDHVDEQAAHSGWASVMMQPGFAAPNLVELARLGAWTLKPAILRHGG